MQGKSTFLAVLMAAVLCATLPAATHQFTGLWDKPGLSLRSSTPSGAELSYSLDRMEIGEVVIDGEAMHQATVPGLYTPWTEGRPDLPHFGSYLAVPQGGRARVEIISDDVETFASLNIAPAPRKPRDDNRLPLSYFKDQAVYGRNAFYPESPVMASSPIKMRGVDAVMLNVSPLQFNPATGELRVHKNLRFRVVFEGGNGRFGEDRLRSRWWDPILAGNLMNYDQLPAIDYGARAGSRDGHEYVIIVPNDANCLAWADTIKQWRTLQGISTGVFTTAVTGTTPAAIETWINNAYNTWGTPPVAILLIGDRPGQGSYAVDARVVTESGETFPSDNRYADVDGDSLPDINVARITPNQASDLPMMINKFLSYERNPYTSANFYNEPISVVGYQSDRWFQLCGEVVYGFWKNHQGKNAKREYYATSPPSAGSPWSTQSTYGSTPAVVHYWKTLGYCDSLIPAGLSWNTTAAAINADINSGCFIVQHRDHGSETGWADPPYTQNNARALTNTMYPFIFTINCLTGAYQQTSPDVSLGEAFHRQQYGALGFIGPTEVSYSFVNDCFTWGMYDCMWPDFDPGNGNTYLFGEENLRPGFAHVYGKYYLQAKEGSWINMGAAYDVITYDLFHMHGDAFTTLYSQMPQDLTVSHPGALVAGVTTFPVTADEGAFIALTVNGEIIGTGTAPAKGTANITIPPQTPGNSLVITATKANYRRYSATVPITAAGGPYILHLKHTLSDASGNGDGVANPGETVRLPTWVINYGTATANGVVGKLRTSSPNGSVTADSAYSFGDIGAGDSAYYAAGFGVYVNPGDTNGMTIPLTLECRDVNDSAWTSSFSVTVGTGVLTFNARTIGGNGRLDPGETAGMAIALKNNGLGYSYGTNAILRCSDARVTVTDSMAGYGIIAPGATGGSGTDSFQVSVGAMPPGTSVGFTVVMKAADEGDRLYSWNETVGDLRYSPTPDNAATPIYYAVEDSDGVSRAPVYQWVEIRGLGTQLTALSADDAYATMTMPFTFRWYGSNYTQLSACSNGFISLGSNTSTAYTNTAIPTSTFSNGAIFPLWDDLNGSSSSAPGAWAGYYHDAAGGRFIVEWDSLVFFGTSTRLKFQAMFYDSTAGHPYYDVVLQYAMLADRGSSSVGFQQNSTVGCQLLQDGAYASTVVSPLKAGRAIRITRTPEVTGVSGGPGAPLGNPTAFSLGAAWPNPVRGSTTISFGLPKESQVRVEVYNITGQRVKSLVNGKLGAGYHRVSWKGQSDSGQKVAAGIYLVRMVTPEFTGTRKMTVLR
jgi:hypothetical protein